MKAILLIGGRGMRLRPLTLQTPKPLLPLLNRPFISHQIGFLRSQGIRDMILCIAYRGQAFRRALGDGRALGVRLSYVFEKTPLGTGGAIKNAEKLIDGCTLICNGDNLLDLDVKAFLAFHRRRKALLTIALTRVPNPTAYGMVDADRQGRIQRFVEKPGPGEKQCDTINAGAYLFEPSVFSRIPKNSLYSVERQLFPQLLAQGEKLYSKVQRGYWLDMGTIDKYLQAHLDLLNGKFPSKIPGARRKGPVWIEKDVRIDPSATLNGPILIGRGAVIDAGVNIRGPVVIGPRSRMRRGSSIEQSVLLEHVLVGERSRLFNVVVAPNTTLEPGSSPSPGLAMNGAPHFDTKKEVHSHVF